MQRIVLSLGGNALGNNPKDQIAAIKIATKSIIKLIEQGNQLIISHGNGPQIGMINLTFDYTSKNNSKIPHMPFPECSAMSQGYIGYHLQNTIGEALRKKAINKPVVSLVTQVEVSANDLAFNNPTKPIGNFYSKEEADKMKIKMGFTIKEDSGRGYRRVIASPKPIDIVEKQAIKMLIKDCIIIASGGGGIPVIKKGNSYQGVEAVIDKDFSSEKIAEIVDANLLIILTAVDKIAINFGKPNQENLTRMNIQQAKQYSKDGHFAPGSMLPKVEAAIKFVESKTGRKALITSLAKANDALVGKDGTLIG